MPSPGSSFYGSASTSPTTEDILAFSRSKSEKDRSADSVKRSLFQLPTNDSKQPSQKSTKSVFYSVKQGSAAGSKSPKRSERASCIRCAVIWTVVAVIAALLIAVLVMYVVIPVVFYSSNAMRRRLMFVGWSRSVPDTLHNPAALGLTCSVNKPTMGVNGIIGTWYVPAARGQTSRTCKTIDAILEESPSFPLVFLIPTFEQHRATPERVALLKTISATLHYHVVTFDYIGLADSADGLPRFDTVVADATEVFKKLRKIKEMAWERRPLIFWGDTWGAPVALELARKQKLSRRPILILQSPVESTALAAAKALPFNKLWRGMPLFDKLFVESLVGDKATNINSLEIIRAMVNRFPSMIIHAQDDATVNISQGVNIYHALTKLHRHDNNSVVLVNVSSNFKLGHQNVLDWPHLNVTIVNFVQSNKYIG